jgi:hypothetical protein
MGMACSTHRRNWIADRVMMGIHPEGKRVLGKPRSWWEKIIKSRSQRNAV